MGRKLGLASTLAALAIVLPAGLASAHTPAGAVGGTPIAERATKSEMIAARERFFGRANVDQRTGAVRDNRVILSWFGVSGFAMAINGKVVLLDSWVPRGAHSGYVPTSPAELAALRPKLIFTGHAHFDHAADAVPIALASGARLVGLAQHCAEFVARSPERPPRCRSVLPESAGPGDTARLGLLPGVSIIAFKHLHSSGTLPDGADGYHLPVLPFSPSATLEHPPTLEDMLELFGHLPDSEGGSVLYRFRVGRFELVWHDTSGPLVEQAPGALAKLRKLGPVDVEIGGIQGFNQHTNGLRDPRTYIEAIGPRVFVPSHHDDWAIPGITAKGYAYKPYLDAELERIPAPARPKVRFISDPRDYVNPHALQFRVGRKR